MKKIFFIYISLLIAGSVFAQKKSFAKTDFKFGSGLETQFNDGDYLFNIGGFIQTDGKYTKTEGSKSENRFDIKSAYLTMEGKAVNEKVGFILRLDFSESSPLMDAIISYQPISFLNLSVGQKQTFTNNREMMFMENTLSMVDRSMLSQKLSGKGRELGIFAESEFLLGNIGIMPQIAVTTGDGRNSFGTSSTDVDRGGLKYGARLDICPLGLFTEGNDLVEADLAREQTPKVKVGVAGSYNSGASNSMGEGHGDFTLYNEEGKDKLPDYKKVYLDVLFKYQGFTVLGEYGNFTATRLKGIYKNSNGTGLLEPGQISEYLNLGDSYNIQAGYVLRSGLAFDLRYSKTKPEFESNSNSVLKNINAYDVAVTKYFVDNRLKIQGGFSYLDYKSEAIRNEIKAEVLLQVTF